MLWQAWRLVGNEELYDLQSDPAQQRNVAEQHADVIAEMRKHYEQWWNGIAPNLNEFSRVVLGSDAENPALLSPCEWADVFLDQMAQVRRGERKNGIWHVEFERRGNLRIYVAALAGGGWPGNCRRCTRTSWSRRRLCSRRRTAHFQSAAKGRRL